jgi:truncated hemoglobin YjbI
MALDHWKKWLPEMTREMRKDGTLNEEAQKASKQAAEQVANLMANGLQKHEAEEFVLPELILLPPER